ncbi:asparagine synthase (glutamine-hydrolyzing) [Zobellia alginiliquefaciens]|uniref:asparagine synthase (glutamine-hydrolyzing) n=1 Tax=Zobellia alginiliquefaciens TaxID=3032586 RepID=UPI0023E3616B|nr:asparagine synthase (glutamine-hydrolyzing) [Zobellia alginiliquefaciens]
MCGIYGTTISYTERQVKKKLEVTSFRGPDQMGIETYKNRLSTITFGHNRLSIIDLDPRSNQPFNYQNRVNIVFNGEIFNFGELKAILRKKGHSFSTESDTEVICAAYLEYGTECLSLFNGMFSFVIYDIEKQLLFGARDRLGQKPFYYYHNGDKFEFASQLSSIQLFNPNLTISENSITSYLNWNSVPPPSSIFNEIKKLKDGHFLIFDIKDSTLNIEKYWDIDYQGKTQFTGSYELAQTQLESLLKDAINKRLFADVPVGVFLSGGIDSSLIAAIATETSEKQIKTFSVKFDEKKFDESEYSKEVANHLGTNHNIIECNYKEGINLIQNFHDFFDEPFADSSAIPSMLLSKHTKKHVTVALSGDGGDEAFLGYSRYTWVKSKKKIYKIPSPARDIISNFLNTIPYKNNRFKTFSQYLKLSNIEEAYIKSMTTPDTTWIKPYPKKQTIEELKYLFHTKKNIYERISDFDLKTYLSWDINTKVDRASMAYSLEVRSPLLDYRIIEFSRSLPTSYKFDANSQKKILRSILFKYVPKEIFNRPKKGFSIPFEEWFRNELKDFVMDELSPTQLKTIPGINHLEVKKLITQHMDGSWNHYLLIWKLLVLKQWLDNNGKGFSIQ